MSSLRFAGYLGKDHDWKNPVSICLHSRRRPGVRHEEIGILADCNAKMTL